jgi:DNA (cytosine-5)-methyltransferase 1
MKFGSVCSGIEAASVAWHPLGWEAAWLSEIEPFPSAVLAHHYPEVPNLGDMTTLPDRILSGDVEAPDLFCGGTPCQAFSVAGLRNSLDDARGNLSLTFVGIANAIDYVRSVRGDSPAIIFWENVPGVLSTKDNAFGCFLGALAGEDGAVVPSGEKWTNAGCVYGPQRAVAWRVLDAQYFGVAQRRRRVFVVASARDNFNPAEVLFEFQGVRRDIAPRREARQRIAPCVTNGPPFSRTGNERVEAEAMVAVSTERRTASGKSTFGTLMANVGTKLWLGNQEALSGDYHILEPIGFETYAIQGSMIGRNDNAGPQGDGINVELCFTQNTIDRHAVAQPINFGAQMSVPQVDFDLCQTLQAKNPMAVAQPIPIDTMNMTPGHSSGGLGFGQPGDPSFTLTKGHSHAVAQPIGFTRCDHGGDAVIDGTPTMRCGSNYSAHLAASIPIAQPIAVAPTLTASNDPSRSPQSTEVTNQVAAVHAVSMAVRRLTPTECERLQGFPDGYTEIPWRKKPASECPDGPRYKALGNSWAVPVVHWIGKRIQAQLTK